MQAEERAWLFDRGKWSEIEEKVFSLISAGQARDLDHALSLAGYGQDPILHLGSDEEGLSADIYNVIQGETPEYPYYVLAALTNTTECIYVTDFPSLLMFLSQFGTALSGLVI